MGILWATSVIVTRNEYMEGKMSTARKGAVKIRPMVRSDIDPVLAMWWSSFIANREMVASQLGGLRDLSLIAEVEGHLAGFVLARVEYLGIPIKEVCSVQAIAVQPEYRQQGVGSLLMRTLKSNCRSKKTSTLRVVVDKSDNQLLGYFQRLGFHQSDVINLEQDSSSEA